MSCSTAQRFISASVQAQFAGHHAGDVRRLDQVLEHVLPVAGAVAQPAEQADQLSVHAGDAQLDQGVLAGPDAQLLDFGLAALVGFLDALRMDAAVQHQPLQGQPADLPPHRVEAGQQDRLGRVIDDQVDPGDRLEGADVPALAADDPALHLVAGQVQHGHHRLAGLLGGDPLDGQRDHLAGALLALGPGLMLDVPHHQGGLALGLVLDDGDQLGLGLDGGQPGHPLQLGLALVVQLVDFGGAVGQGALALVQFGGPVLQAVQFLVQPLLPVGQPVLAAFQIAAQLADLVLDRADLGFDLAAALAGLFGGQLSLGLDRGGFGLGPGPDLLGVAVGGFECLGGRGRDGGGVQRGRRGRDGGVAWVAGVAAGALAAGVAGVARWPRRPRWRRAGGAAGVAVADGGAAAAVAAVAPVAAGAGVSAVRPGVLVAAAAGLEAAPAGWPGALSVAVPDLRQTTTSANTAARSPIAMNTKAMPPLTVTPSAHQVPSPGTASAIPGKYALARGVLHAGACGRYYGSLAWAAGCGRDAGGRSAGGGRPSLAFGRGSRPGGM